MLQKKTAEVNVIKENTKINVTKENRKKNTIKRTYNIKDSETEEQIVEDSMNFLS